MKEAPAIGFRYRASPTLVAATMVIALLAVIAAWLVRGPVWLHATLTALIVVYAGMETRTQIRPPMQSLLLRVDGGVELRLRDRALEGGKEVLGAVQGARMLGPLIVLTLRWPPRECVSLWLLPDNLDADTRRRLRMRLGSGAGNLASGNADSG